MNICLYRTADLPAPLALFYDTVHTVCAGDYSPAQLDAWAPAKPDASAWDASLRSRTTLVTEEGGNIEISAPTGIWTCCMSTGTASAGALPRCSATFWRHCIPWTG